MKDSIEIKLRKDLEDSLSEKRFNHTMSVYRAAKELAEIYGENTWKVAVAALGHDFTKEWRTDRNKVIMDKYFKNEEVYKIEPAWHGYTASVILNKIYDIEDISILNAIKYHTIGHQDMDNVAKVVYIADFIEPTRKKNNVEHFWELVGEVNLDTLLYEVMTYNIDYLKGKGSLIPKQTLDLYESLKNSI